MMKLVATCCVVPKYKSGVNYTSAYQSGLAPTADKDTLRVLRETTTPFRASPITSGPLVDSLLIEETSSAVPRALANGPGFPLDAFASVKKRRGGRGRYENPEALFTTNAAASLTDLADAVRAGAFLKATAKFGVGFGGEEWGFRVDTHGFKGALVVTRHGAAESLAVVETVRGNGGINFARTTLHLTPGVYEVSLYGVYDKTGEKSSHSSYSPNDAILFRQPSVCKVHSWTLLSDVALKNCGGGEDKEKDRPVAELPPRHTKSNSTGNSNSSPRKVFKTESAKLTANNREGFEGAFFSMKIGGMPSELKDNYLVMQGRFSLLGMMIEIDISMRMGPAKEGGGIYMHFYFLWAVGTQKLGELDGKLDVTPFDFSGGKGWKALLDITISLSVSIKPHMFNLAMMIIEPVIKALMMAIIMPLLLAIVAAQIALEIAIAAVEAARKVVNAARQALDVIQKTVDIALHALKGEEMKYQRMENTVDLLESSGYRSRCRQIKTSRSSTGCSVAGRSSKTCKYEISPGFDLPRDCRAQIKKWNRLKEHYDDECCGLWTKIARGIKRMAIKIAEFIIKVVLIAPRLMLKIVEEVLRAVEVTLKLAEDAIRQSLKAIAGFLNAAEVLDKNNRLMLGAFTRWLARVQLLRVNEMSVATTFDPKVYTFAAGVHVTVLSSDIFFELKFAFNFKKILKAICDWLKDTVTDIITGGGDDKKDAATALSALGFGEATSGGARRRRSPLLLLSDGASRGFHTAHHRTLFPRSTPVAATGGRDATVFYEVLGHRSEDHVGQVAFVDEEGELHQHLAREHDVHAAVVATVASIASRGASRGGSEWWSKGHAATSAELTSHLGKLLSIANHRNGDFHHHHNHADDVGDTSALLHGGVFEACAAPILATRWHESCAASALTAAVACGGDGGGGVGNHARSPAACAAALGAVHSKRCTGDTASSEPKVIDALRNCAAHAASALPCGRECSSSIVSIGRSCGGFLPRMETGFYANDADEGHRASELCDSRIVAAQNACSSSSSDRFCARLLEATPEALEHSVASHAQGMSHLTRLMFWSEQQVRGVVPSSACAAGAGALKAHVDLRGNALLGTVPACMWAQKGGAHSVHLSRNRLSGTVGRLGDHVRHLHVGHNKLSGEISDAIRGAKSLETLDVSENSLHGKLGFLGEGGHRKLHRLDVRGNSFTDRGGGAALHETLAGLPSLGHYDVAGNNFDPERLHPSTPRGPEAVHAVLHFGMRASHFCPSCPAHSLGLGEMCASGACSRNQHSPDEAPEEMKFLKQALDASPAATGVQIMDLKTALPWGHRDLLEGLKCGIEAALRDKMGDHVGARVSFERVFPYTAGARNRAKGDPEITVVALTVRFDSPSSSSSSAPGRVAAATAVLRALAARGEVPAHEAACASHALGAEDMGALKYVDARPGCDTGLMGARCQYSCRGRWDRVSETVYSASQVHSAPSSAQDEEEEEAVTPEREAAALAKIAGVKSETTADAVMMQRSVGGGYSSTSSSAPTLGRGRIVAAAAARVEEDDEEEELEEGDDYYMYRHEGVDKHGKPHTLSSSLTECTGHCRATAVLAVDACSVWLRAKTNATRRSSCSMKLNAVQSACGVKWNRECASGHASYTVLAERDALPSAAPHPCEVCGIHHFFETHGLHDPSRDHHVPLLGGKGLARRARENARKRIAERAALGGAEERRASALAHEISASTFGRYEDRISAAALEAAHAHAERAVGDAEGGIFGGSHVHDDGVSLAAATAEQFPTCQMVNLGCSDACVGAGQDAMTTCNAWLDEPNEASASAAAAKDACAQRLSAAGNVCTPSEHAKCIVDAADSFYALGVRKTSKPRRSRAQSARVVPDGMRGDDNGASPARVGAHVRFASPSTTTTEHRAVLGGAPAPTREQRLSDVCWPVDITRDALNTVCQGKSPGVSSDVMRALQLGASSVVNCTIPDARKPVTFKMKSANVVCDTVSSSPPKTSIMYRLYVTAETTSSLGSIPGVATLADDATTSSPSLLELTLHGGNEFTYYAAAGFEATVTVTEGIVPLGLPVSVISNNTGLNEVVSFNTTALIVEFSGPAYETPASRDAVRVSGAFNILLETPPSDDSHGNITVVEVTGNVTNAIYPWADVPLTATGVASVSQGGGGDHNTEQANIALLEPSGASVVFYPAETSSASDAAAVHIRASSAAMNDDEGSGFPQALSLIVSFDGSWTAESFQVDGSSSGNRDSAAPVNTLTMSSTSALRTSTAGDEDARRLTFRSGGVNLFLVGVLPEGTENIPDPCVALRGRVVVKVGALMLEGGSPHRAALPAKALEVPAWASIGSCGGRASSGGGGVGVATFSAVAESWLVDGSSLKMRDVYLTGSIFDAFSTSEDETKKNMTGKLIGRVDLSDGVGDQISRLSGGWGVATVPFWITNEETLGKTVTGYLKVDANVALSLGKESSPYLTLEASEMQFALPCSPGTVVHLPARMSLNLGIFRIVGGDIVADMTCGVGHEVEGHSIRVDASLDPYFAIPGVSDSAAVGHLIPGVHLDTLGPVRLTSRLARGDSGWFWAGKLSTGGVLRSGGEKRGDLTTSIDIDFSTAAGKIANPDANVSIAMEYATEAFTLKSSGVFPTGPCTSLGLPYVFETSLEMRVPNAKKSFIAAGKMARSCTNSVGETRSHVTASLRNAEIVPGSVVILYGDIDIKLTQSAKNSHRFETVEGRIWGVLDVDSGAGGAPKPGVPNFPSANLQVNATLDMSYGEDKRSLIKLIKLNELKISASMAFEDGKRTGDDGNWWKLEAHGSVTFPCKMGQQMILSGKFWARFGAHFDLGEEGLYAEAIFSCGISGIEAPVFSLEVSARGTVRIIKGLAVDDFSLLAAVYFTDRASFPYDFKGSVSGVLVANLDDIALLEDTKDGDDNDDESDESELGKLGAFVDFRFDTIANTWRAASVVEYTSRALNASLSVNVGSCSPEGSSVGGKFSINLLGTDFKGAARGHANCGEYAQYPNHIYDVTFSIRDGSSITFAAEGDDGKLVEWGGIVFTQGSLTLNATYPLSLTHPVDGGPAENALASTWEARTAFALQRQQDGNVASLGGGSQNLADIYGGPSLSPAALSASDETALRMSTEQHQLDFHQMESGMIEPNIDAHYLWNNINIPTNIARYDAYSSSHHRYSKPFGYTSPIQAYVWNSFPGLYSGSRVDIQRAYNVLEGVGEDIDDDEHVKRMNRELYDFYTQPTGLGSGSGPGRDNWAGNWMLGLVEPHRYLHDQINPNLQRFVNLTELLSLRSAGDTNRTRAMLDQLYDHPGKQGKKYPCLPERWSMAMLTPWAFEEEFEKRRDECLSGAELGKESGKVIKESYFDKPPEYNRDAGGKYYEKLYSSETIEDYRRNKEKYINWINSDGNMTAAWVNPTVLRDLWFHHEVDTPEAKVPGGMERLRAGFQPYSAPIRGYSTYDVFEALTSYPSAFNDDGKTLAVDSFIEAFNLRCLPNLAEEESWLEGGDDNATSAAKATRRRARVNSAADGFVLADDDDLAEARASSEFDKIRQDRYGEDYKFKRNPEGRPRDFPDSLRTYDGSRYWTNPRDNNEFNTDYFKKEGSKTPGRVTVDESREPSRMQADKLAAHAARHGSRPKAMTGFEFSAFSLRLRENAHEKVYYGPKPYNAALFSDAESIKPDPYGGRVGGKIHADGNRHYSRRTMCRSQAPGDPFQLGDIQEVYTDTYMEMAEATQRKDIFEAYRKRAEAYYGPRSMRKMDHQWCYENRWKFSVAECMRRRMDKWTTRRNIMGDFRQNHLYGPPFLKYNADYVFEEDFGACSMHPDAASWNEEYQGGSAIFGRNTFVNPRHWHEEKMIQGFRGHCPRGRVITGIKTRAGRLDPNWCLKKRFVLDCAQTGGGALDDDNAVEKTTQCFPSGDMLAKGNRWSRPNIRYPSASDGTKSQWTRGQNYWTRFCPGKHCKPSFEIKTEPNNPQIQVNSHTQTGDLQMYFEDATNVEVNYGVTAEMYGVGTKKPVRRGYRYSGSNVMNEQFRMGLSARYKGYLLSDLQDPYDKYEVYISRSKYVPRNRRSFGFEQIHSLRETEELDNGVNWRRNQNRYFVVGPSHAKSGTINGVDKPECADDPDKCESLKKAFNDDPLWSMTMAGTTPDCCEGFAEGERCDLVLTGFALEVVDPKQDDECAKRVQDTNEFRSRDGEATNEDGTMFEGKDEYGRMRKQHYVRFRYTCKLLLASKPPPPPAPPPPVPVDLLDLDWRGKGYGQGRMGADMQHIIPDAFSTMAASSASVDFDFAVKDNEFSVNKFALQLSIDIPIKIDNGTMEGFEAHLRGKLKVHYPCVADQPLLYGEVSLNLRYDPIIKISDMFCSLRYTCDGDDTLEVKASLDLLQVMNYSLEMVNIEIHLSELKDIDGSNTSSAPGTSSTTSDVNVDSMLGVLEDTFNDFVGWGANGTISGMVSMTRDGSDENFGSLDNAQMQMFFMFSTITGEFAMAFNVTVGTWETPVRFELTGTYQEGICDGPNDVFAKHGTHMKVRLNVDFSEHGFEAIVRGYGARYCSNPDDATAERVRLDLSVLKFDIGNGIFLMDNVTMNAVGRGTYHTNISDLHWHFSAGGSMRLAEEDKMGNGSYAGEISGTGNIDFTMRRIPSSHEPPAVTKNGTAFSISVEEDGLLVTYHIEIVSIYFEPKLDLRIGTEHRPAFTLKAHARVSFPCTTSLIADGSVSLDVGGFTVPALSARGEIFCPEISFDGGAVNPTPAYPRTQYAVSYPKDLYGDCDSALISEVFWSEYQAEMAVRSAKNRHGLLDPNKAGYCAEHRASYLATKVFEDPLNDLPAAVVAQMSLGERAFEFNAWMQENDVLSVLEGSVELRGVSVKLTGFDSSAKAGVVNTEYKIVPLPPMKYTHLVGTVIGFASLEPLAMIPDSPVQMTVHAGVALKFTVRSPEGGEPLSEFNLTDQSYSLTVRVDVLVPANDTAAAPLVKATLMGAGEDPCVYPYQIHGYLGVSVPGSLEFEAEVNGYLGCAMNTFKYDVSVPRVLIVNAFIVHDAKLQVSGIVTDVGGGGEGSRKRMTMDVFATGRVELVLESLQEVVKTDGTGVFAAANFTIDGAGRFNLHSLVISFTYYFEVSPFADTPPVFSTAGSAEYYYPCTSGGTYRILGTSDIRTEFINVTGAASTVAIACDWDEAMNSGRDDAVLLTMLFKIPEFGLPGFIISDVEIFVNVTSQSRDSGAYGISGYLVAEASYRHGSLSFGADISWTATPQVSADGYVEVKYVDDDVLVHAIGGSNGVTCTVPNATWLEVYGTVAVFGRKANDPVFLNATITNGVLRCADMLASPDHGVQQLAVNLAVARWEIVPDVVTITNAYIELDVELLISNGNQQKNPAAKTKGVAFDMRAGGNLELNTEEWFGPEAIAGVKVRANTHVSMPIEGTFTVHSLSVTAEARFLVANNDSADVPYFDATASFTYAYPCNAGSTAYGSIAMQMNFGTFKMTKPLQGDVIYYCGAYSANTSVPLIKVDVYQQAPVELAPAFHFEGVRVSVLAFSMDETFSELEFSGLIKGDLVMSSESVAASLGSAAPPPSFPSLRGVSLADHWLFAADHPAIAAAATASASLTAEERWRSNDLGAALLGAADESDPVISHVRASTKFVFDTRDGSFAASVDLSLEVGCFKMTLGGDVSQCGSGKPKTIMGTVGFDCENTIRGGGSVGGKVWMGEEDEPRVYDVALSIPSLTLTLASGSAPSGNSHSNSSSDKWEFSIKNVTVSAVGRKGESYYAHAEANDQLADGTCKGDGLADGLPSGKQLDWSFEASGIAALSVAPGAANVGNGVTEGGGELSTMLHVSASMSPIGGGAFIVKAVKAKASFVFETPYEPGEFPAARITATGSYNYPCLYGDVVPLSASLSLNIQSLDLSGAQANLNVYCGDPPKNFTGRYVRHAVTASIERFGLDVLGMRFGLEDVAVSMRGVEIHDGFGNYTMAIVGSFAGTVYFETQDEVDADAVSDFSASMRVALQVDTYANELKVAVKATVNIVGDVVVMDTYMKASSPEGCDKRNGDIFTGALTAKLWEGATINASFTGQRHCAGHESFMRGWGESPDDPVAAYTKATLETRGAGAPAKPPISRGIFPDDDFTFPSVELTATIERCDIAPGVAVDSARLDLRGYGKEAAMPEHFEKMQWIGQFTSSAIVDVTEWGVAVPILSARAIVTAGLVFDPLAKDDSKMVAVGAVVKASFNMDLNTSIGMEIIGTVIAPVPCSAGDVVTLNARALIGAEGDFVRLDAEAAGFVYCGDHRGPDSLVSKITVVADEAAIGNDVFVISDVKLMIGVHNNPETNETWFTGVFEGTCTLSVNVTGMYAMGRVTLDRSGEWYVEAEVGLTAPGLVLALTGRGPAGHCDDDGWTFNGRDRGSADSYKVVFTLGQI